jgi:hypothetical protein
MYVPVVDGEWATTLLLRSESEGGPKEQEGGSIIIIIIIIIMVFNACSFLALCRNNANVLIGIIH